MIDFIIIITVTYGILATWGAVKLYKKISSINEMLYDEAYRKRKQQSDERIRKWDLASYYQETERNTI